MQNVIAIWKELTLRRRIVVVGASLLVFLAILALARQSQTRNLGLLYAGLDPQAAGEVIAALDQRGLAYEVRGESIFVAADQRDSLRLSLAGEGLPAAGGAGYELLDSLSGFGTTSQMFDVAYWRAKEGELARTIRTMPMVKTARVHIARGQSDPFRRTDPPTASVTLTTRGGGIGEDQARAIRHLVASAVAGMRSGDVQVIDAASGLIPTGEDTAADPSGSTNARAEAIRQSVERLLAARVGPGKAVVEVAVELITEREQITERRLDPESRVAISSDTEERNEKNTDGSGNEVTVASNLPDGAAAAGERSSTAQSSETRERLNFEVSETQRDLLRAPGGIKRMSVAVLVDGQMITAPDGSLQWQARSDEELAALRELVAAAVGLDEQRGDSLTLKSMEFVAPPELGSEAGTGFLPEIGPIDLLQIVQIAALSLVALVLGLFVIRPLLAPRARNELPAPNAPLALPPLAGGGGEPLSGSIEQEFPMGDLPVIDFSAGLDEVPEDPASRLRRLIGERQKESLEILRSWLDPEEERS